MNNKGQSSNAAGMAIVTAFIVLAVIGVVQLISITITSKVGASIESSLPLDARTVVNESITITATTITVTNESITMTSGTGTTGNGSVRSITYFGNVTNSTDLASISVGLQINLSKSGVITVDTAEAFPADGIYNISYTFSRDVTGTTANDGVSGVTFFGNVSNNTFLSTITIGTHVNFTEPGVITLDSHPFDPGTYNISYGYNAETAYHITKAKLQSDNLSSLELSGTAQIVFASIVVLISVFGILAIMRGRG